MTEKEKLGIIIKYNRKKHGLNQIELAKALIYDQSVISRIEKGYESINIDLYKKVLSYFNIFHEKNAVLEHDILIIINLIYSSYEILNINRFRDFVFEIDKYLQMNQNCIVYYDLMCLKMVSLYMLSQIKAKSYLKELESIYHICNEKCQVLYDMVQFQYFLFENPRLDLEQLTNKINLKKDLQNGLMYYLWGKFFFKSFNYTKAIEYFLKAIDHFQKENNVLRKLRCEMAINEIFLTNHQYELVKYRNLNYIKLKDKIISLDYQMLKFQLAYCYYHLEEFDKSHAIFKELVVSLPKSKMIKHLYHKCLYKLGQVDKNNINDNNPYDGIYFNEDRKQSYFTSIEKHYLPNIDTTFYLKETQYYVYQLLDYYFSSKKYNKYKQLSQQINKILHNY